MKKTIFADGFLVNKAAVPAKVNGEAGVIIEGYANTAVIDRTGDIILPSAWVRGCEEYRKNPILLFAHKQEAPIGKVISMRTSKEGLHVEAFVSAAAEKTHNIITLIKDKVLKSFSVGFRVKENKFDRKTGANTITDLELLEISVVSIPANQGSLFSLRKNFETEEEYLSYLKNFDIKEKKSLKAGVTSLDESHYHAFEVDGDGTGITTFTSHGHEFHVHEIVDGQVKEANDHSHQTVVIDTISDESPDESKTVELLDEKEETIIMEEEKVVSEPVDDVSQEAEVSETSNEIEDKEEIVAKNTEQEFTSDEDSNEFTEETDEEVIEEIGNDNEHTPIPFVNELSFGTSNIPRDSIVKIDEDYKSYQSFTYFQLKRNQNPRVVF